MQAEYLDKLETVLEPSHTALIIIDIQRARRYAERAMDRVKTMRSDDADSRHIAKAEATACLNLGQVLIALARPEEAEMVWQQGLTAIEPLASGLTDPQARGLQAMTLLCLQRPDEAQPIVDELLERGYRYPEFMRLTANSNPAPSPLKERG